MAAVARLYRATYDDRLPWLAGRHTPDQDRRFFREQVFPSCETEGAFADGDLAGFIAVGDCWVRQLYVLPGMQSRGIGSALLSHAQARSPHLSLWAFRRNTAARAFYVARGFLLVRETDGAENEEREPAALYEWTAPV
jgi:putative acetyltransferase